MVDETIECAMIQRQRRGIRVAQARDASPRASAVMWLSPGSRRGDFPSLLPQAGAHPAQREECPKQMPFARSTKMRSVRREGNKEEFLFSCRSAGAALQPSADRKGLFLALYGTTTQAVALLRPAQVVPWSGRDRRNVPRKLSTAITLSELRRFKRSNFWQELHIGRKLCEQRRRIVFPPDETDRQWQVQIDHG
jgi:hypothetical protein